MKKNKKLVLFAIILIIVSIIVKSIYEYRNNIGVILKSESYSYLPLEAKNYIKTVYEKTGNVILTEKNKKENTLYLNPQYVDYLSSSEDEKKEFGDIPISMIVDYSIVKDIDGVTVPSSYDLRNVSGNNYVTPVRDQGNLGICWAFATAGVAETHLLNNNNTSYSSSSKLISERQIDYATSRNGISDYKSEYVSFINRSLGDGGNFYISTIAMANGISLIDYDSFKPYNDKDLQKMELSNVLNYNNSLYEVNSTINFPRLNLRDSTSVLTEEEQATRTSYLNEVKQNIIENGAAYVSTYMSSECQYTDSSLNNTVIDVYSCGIYGGHAMEIIGWNDEIEYSYCADTDGHTNSISECDKIVSGKGVWILKNSWGNTKQHPYLTYDSLYTSISFIDEVSSTSDKTWDNNYILGDDYENITEKSYSLSGTKIKSNEAIKKIKFITETPGATYNIKIFKENGTFETFTKSTTLPGLVTIDIPTNIIVNSDTTIVISGMGGFIDNIGIFTKNIDNIPYVNTEKYNGITLSSEKIRLYSETKNVSSGTSLVYKLYNSNNEEISDNVSFTNNIVAENNINTLAIFSTNLDAGIYRIDVIYNSNVVSTFNFNITKMDGLGTKDNPYKITNSIELSQIRNDLDAYYELENDIDLTEDTHEGGTLSLESNTCPQGFGWEAINNFSGSLDGKGYSIKGLYQNNYLKCNVEKEEWAEWEFDNNGLFNSTSGNVTIKNLILENFDINCMGSSCGALVSNYNANNNNYDDQTEYTANFKNIIFKSSDIKGVYNTYIGNSDKYTYGGGLFGYIESLYGKVEISNIYLDINLRPSYLKMKSLLFYSIQANNANIQNIHLSGTLTGKYENGNTDSILNNRLVANTPTKINNVLSTVTSTNVSGSLLGEIWGNNLTISGVNSFKVLNENLCSKYGQVDACSKATNVNLFDKNTQLEELTKRLNYDTWENFDDNWIMRTIDGIPRIPVLKFMDFEYTSIPNILVDQELNKTFNIKDYIIPNIEAAKRINYKSNNESIVKFDPNGNILPQKTGSTTVHIESYYDGYIKDVPISVTYVPHYNVAFDSNGGTGTMDTIEVDTESNYTLPNNMFDKEHYVFTGWNTKADGTGESYTNLGQVSAMSDKKTITLYAQWTGEKIMITFDPNSGIVTPNRKTVNYGGTYGDLPIPTKEGYAFRCWRIGDIKIDAHSNLVGNVLKAIWQENAYTIIYDANNGVLNSNITDSNMSIMSNSLVTTYAINGEDKSLSNNIYEKFGNKFKEWNTKSDGTGTSYTESQVINMTNVTNNTLRLYAIWEFEVGTITFNSNYGTNQTTIQNFTYNTSTKLNKNSFTRTGCVFVGWNTKADGTGIIYTDEQLIENMIESNLNLYAQWNLIEYTISFDPNGSSNEIHDWRFNYPTLGRIGLGTSGFKKENYVLDSWNTKADGTGIKYLTNLNDNYSIAIDDIPFDENYHIVIYAQWKKVEYSVTFAANGGTGTMENQMFAFDDSKLLSLNTLTKIGHTFKNWNTKQDGSGDTYSNGQIISISKNIILYAQWEPISYKIKYNSNGGTGNMSDQTMIYGTSYNLTENTFTKSNYKFKNWNTKQDGSGTSYNNIASISNLTTENNKEIILYAQWEPISYKIKYNSNGGTGNMSDQTMIYGTSYNLTENTFTKSNYKFKNWNTKQDGSGTSYNNIASISNLTTENNKEIILYAQWEEDYIVIVNTYIYNETDKYIDNIPINTSYLNYKNKLTLNNNYSMQTYKGLTLLQDNDYIGTGSVTKIFNSNNKIVLEISNIVRGDANGDGKISSADYIKIKKHIMQTEVIINNIYFYAADVNNDTKISSADYVKIRKYIMNGESI